MRRRKLKNWFKNLLLLIQCAIIILLACENTIDLMYVVSRLIMLIMLIVNHHILYTYSDLFDEDDINI